MRWIPACGNRSKAFGCSTVRQFGRSGTTEDLNRRTAERNSFTWAG